MIDKQTLRTYVHLLVNKHAGLNHLPYVKVAVSRLKVTTGKEVKTMKTKSAFNRAGILVAVWSIGVYSLPLFAAQAGPQADNTADRANWLEEVVVTAERRTTRLMETPIPASVLSQEELRVRGITDLDGLQFTTPSLTVNSYGGGNLVNIRGVGRTEVVTQASAGVPIYRDGLATFNAYFSYAEPYFDIENVQVLRGPQGTFAGQNSTGGAMFITTQNPVLNETGGYGMLYAGNYATIGGQGAINVPVSDTFALRFAADAMRRDGFYNYSGSYTGDPDSFTRGAVRASALWQPTDKFDAVIKVDYNNYDAGANTYAPIGSPDDLYDISSNTHLFAKDKFIRVGATLNYQFDNGFILRSITGYQSGDTRQQSDSDGTDIGFASLFYKATEDLTSQEFNLISPDDRRLKFVLGGYYSDDQVDLPVFLVENPPFSFNIASKLVRKNTAVFGHVTYDITPALTAEIGARYNSASVRQDALTSVSIAGFPLPDTPGPKTIPDDNKTTWKAGLNYAINDQNFLYGFVATGHKNAGLNTSIYSPPAFEGETVTDYEIGYKATLMDNRLRFQASYYHYEYENYQFNQYDVITRSTAILNVPGDAKSNGLELQLDGYFGDTSFNLAASFADSKLPKFYAVDPRNPPPADALPCPPQGPATSPQCVDLSGRELPYQPEITFSGGLEHRFHTSFGVLAPRVDVAYIEDQYTTVFQVPMQDTLDSRFLVNAQLALQKDSWVATLYATNLFDEEYVAAKLSGLRVAGLPRQYGIRLFKAF